MAFRKPISTTYSNRIKPIDGRNGNDLDYISVSDSQNFYFQQRRGELDLRSIASIDIERVVEEVDVEILQVFIGNITFSKLQDSDMKKYTDENFMKLFRLSQLTIEYLLHVQQTLYDYSTTTEKANEKQQKLVKELKERIKTLNSEITLLKKESKTKHKTIEMLEILLRQQPEAVPSSAVSKVYPCIRCKKKFASVEFLSQHTSRKHQSHSDTSSKPKSPIKDNDSELEREKILLREKEKLKKFQLEQELELAKQQLHDHSKLNQVTETLAKQMSELEARLHDEFKHREEAVVKDSKLKEEQIRNYSSKSVEILSRELVSLKNTMNNQMQHHQMEIESLMRSVEAGHGSGFGGDLLSDSDDDEELIDRHTLLHMQAKIDRLEKFNNENIISSSSKAGLSSQHNPSHTTTSSTNGDISTAGAVVVTDNVYGNIISSDTHGDDSSSSLSINKTKACFILKEVIGRLIHKKFSLVFSHFRHLKEIEKERIISESALALESEKREREVAEEVILIEREKEKTRLEIEALSWSPTYDWQPVPRGYDIFSHWESDNLDVVVKPDKEGISRARIKHVWQYPIDLGPGFNVEKISVERFMKLSQLRDTIISTFLLDVNQANGLSFTKGNNIVNMNSTIEEVGLFHNSYPRVLSSSSLTTNNHSYDIISVKVVPSISEEKVDEVVRRYTRAEKYGRVSSAELEKGNELIDPLLKETYPNGLVHEVSRELSRTRTSFKSELVVGCEIPTMTDLTSGDVFKHREIVGNQLLSSLENDFNIDPNDTGLTDEMWNEVTTTATTTSSTRNKGIGHSGKRVKDIASRRASIEIAIDKLAAEKFDDTRTDILNSNTAGSTAIHDKQPQNKPLAATTTLAGLQVTTKECYDGETKSNKKNVSNSSPLPSPISSAASLYGRTITGQPVPVARKNEDSAIQDSFSDYSSVTTDGTSIAETMNTDVTDLSFNSDLRDSDNSLSATAKADEYIHKANIEKKLATEAVKKRRELVNVPTMSATTTVTTTATTSSTTTNKKGEDTAGTNLEAMMWEMESISSTHTISPTTSPTNKPHM